MRSVPEPSSVGGIPATGRDPWAGFGAGPASARSGTAGGGNGARDAGDERAVTDLARRLQDRVDGQEVLLDRLADLAQRSDERIRVSELRDAARRMRRDTEALLLLCGAEPGVHRGGPLTVPAVLGDAVSLVDEPSRAVLRAVPEATLAAPAAVELRHLVAELVDEAAAASPGARVEVGGRLEADGALVVEVVVAGRGWTDALGGGRGGGAPRLAERLARRSSGGIRLERPMIDAVEGLVATLHCPPSLVTAPAVDDPWQLSSFSGASRSRPTPSGSTRSVPSPSEPSPSSSGSSLPGPSWSGSSLSGSSLSGSALSGSGLSDTPLSDSLLSSGADTSLLLTTVPAPSRSNGDELFGPLPSAVGAVGTPIFEAVASAWFRDDERGPGGEDWNSPGDREWRAAAARATRTDVPATTSSGLPRRSPGDRLVPPPRTARPASPPDERVPERVRNRLATYQRGLEQGRHRAADPAPSDPTADAAPEAWTADGW